MSEYADVDASADPSALVSRLDRFDEGLSAMKAYMTEAARRVVADGGRIVDLGCGAGHDLARLQGAGLTPIGVDPSAVMLAASRARVVDGPALVQADGGALPLRDASVDGCRMERVLQHVLDPVRVLAEAARVVRDRGFLAVFEPDWTTVRVADMHDDLLATLVTNVRHPDVGGRLPELVVGAGFDIDDVVIEQSQTSRPEGLPWSIERPVERAMRAGHADAARWLAEVLARADAGTFRAHWHKVLVVASRCAREPSRSVASSA